MYASEGNSGGTREWGAWSGSSRGVGQTDKRTASEGFCTVNLWIRLSSLCGTLHSFLIPRLFLQLSRALSASRALESHSRNFSQRFTPPLPDKLFPHLRPSLTPVDFWLLTFDFWISREYRTERDPLVSLHAPSPTNNRPLGRHFMASRVENTTKTIFFLSGELLMLFCVLRRVPK